MQKESIAVSVSLHLLAGIAGFWLGTRIPSRPFHEPSPTRAIPLHTPRHTLADTADQAILHRPNAQSAHDDQVIVTLRNIVRQDFIVLAIERLAFIGQPGLLAACLQHIKVRIRDQLQAHRDQRIMNFPLPCHVKSEVRRTVPARVVVPGLFSPADDDGTHRLIFRLGDDLSPPEPLTDRAALTAGYISHTVLDYKKLGL